jgi:hypothetical protein
MSPLKKFSCKNRHPYRTFYVEVILEKVNIFKWTLSIP